MLHSPAMLLIAGTLLVAVAASVAVAEQPEVKITVLYDNCVYDKACQSDWGFACLITGMEKTILFDTGRKGDLLLANFEKKAIRPTDVNLVVISHNHDDHLGGLQPFLKENRAVSVFLPAKAPEDVVRDAGILAAETIVVTEPTTICKGAVVFGPMGDTIVEQSLVLDTKKGLVIITGCSHPGIVAMAKRAKEELHRNVYMIVGGTHLLRHAEEDLRSVIVALKELGVQKVAPTHCSGNKAIAEFQKVYGDDYIKTGLGHVIRVDGKLIEVVQEPNEPKTIGSERR